MKVSDGLVAIPTRFIVKNEDGTYAVSGPPGVALCYFGITKSEGFEAALDWYRGITDRDTYVEADYSESIQDLKLDVINSLGLNPDVDSPKVFERLYLGTVHELAWFENESLRVGAALQVLSLHDYVVAYLVLNNSAGELFRNADDGIRYFIKPNESGHSAHIHVNYKNQSFASIYIDTGEYRDGSLPSKVFKVARKRILDNRAKLLEYWNANTNGIHFDINYLFMNQDKQ